jgi:hypothetical protein
MVDAVLSTRSSMVDLPMASIEAGLGCSVRGGCVKGFMRDG